MNERDKEAITKLAREKYLLRLKFHIPGDSEKDWKAAEEQYWNEQNYEKWSRG